MGDWTGLGVDRPGHRIGATWTVRVGGNPPTPTVSPEFTFDFGPATQAVPLSWMGAFPLLNE